jgi:hypothetical protein
MLISGSCTGSKYNSYDAYKELEFYWEDVHLFNTQELIYGRITSRASSVSNTDEIHPRYDAMIKYL